MPTQITINNITGASPFNIYICDNPITICIYEDTITSFPYSFNVPSIISEQSSVSLKVIDNNGCISYQTPSEIPPIFYTIGQSALGGTIAYILEPGDLGYDENVQHGLVATVADIATDVTWGCVGTVITGADGTSYGTGQQNTIDIMNDCSDSGIAARLCGELNEGGYNDWYLPSKDELSKLYINRVAIGGFVERFYWSSTESTNTYAYTVNFYDGTSMGNNKLVEDPVRGVRSF